VVEPMVRPLVDSIAATGGVSPIVLWGNVWSGLVGSLAPLRSGRPDLATPAAAILADLLRIEATSPIPDRHPGTFDPRHGYRRTTCCLLYRLPADPSGAGPALCGDCVLRPPRPSTMR